MKKYFLLFFILSVLGSGLAQDTRLSVTVYNQDRALVRETRDLKFAAGLQTFSFQDVASRMDPTSVHFTSMTAPDGLTILEQNFEYDLVGTSRLLEKYIDQRLMATTDQGRVFSGQLMNAADGDIILRSEDGLVTVLKADAIESIEFPALPEGLITRPTLVWLLNCKVAGAHKTEISYLTGGLGWHAEYVAVLNAQDTELDLSGWVSIQNNSGATFRDARLKLVAGDVNLAQERAPIRPSARIMTDSFAGEQQFEEKSFFEYHLYTLQRPATLADRQMKQLSLFPSAVAKVRKLFSFDAAQDRKVRTSLEFKNSKANALGLPLPKGKIRVYKKDSDGSQEFIGEDLIDHTSKDEDVRVFLGNAFDIVAERTVKEAKDLGKRSRQETIGIELRNHKDTEITVIVVERFWGDWQFIGKTPKVAKKDARKVEFEVQVPKDGSSEITYTVLYR